MPLPLESFVEEVRLERAHQAGRFADGTDEGLDKIDATYNGPESFTAFIAHYASHWFPGGFPPHSTETLLAFRKQMVKVATLAYSAARWADAELETRANQSDF